MILTDSGCDVKDKWKLVGLFVACLCRWPVSYFCVMLVSIMCTYVRNHFPRKDGLPRAKGTKKSSLPISLFGSLDFLHTHTLKHVLYEYIQELWDHNCIQPRIENSFQRVCSEFKEQRQLVSLSNTI